METLKLTSEQAKRQAKDSHYVIFYDGKELETSKSGAINSNGGIVLSAFIEELNCYIEHRSNDNYGRRGFSINGKSVSNEIREKLAYKY